MNACTIVSRRELARARVLMSTFHDHHPEASFTVLLLGVEPESVDVLAQASLVGLSEVAGVGGSLLAAANPAGALTMALLPHLLRRLLADGAESVVYLGCGQRVLGPLDRLRALLAAHQIVLVARMAGNRSFAAFEHEGTRGAFSPQLLGLRAGEASADLLSMWPRYFSDNGDAGSGAVSAWLDSVPALAEDVAVLRDPGYAADPWNLADLPLDSTGPHLVVDASPIVTFDFSAMSTHDPFALCDGEDRVNLSSAPDLAELCTQHADELIAAGEDQYSDRPDFFGRLEGGERLTPTMRRLLVQGIQAGVLTQSPLTDAGRRAFIDYLNAPGDRGKAVGLSRLHMAVWDARHDLQAAYPHIDGPDGAGYAGWLCYYGEEQEGLSPSLVPRTPELAFRDANPLIHEDPPRWGVNVAGFFTAELGVGEAARLLMAGLDARGIPALPIQGHLTPPSRQSVEFAYASPDAAAYPMNIICINGDGLSVFAREAGRSFFDNRYTIALWWWEVGEPPPEWKQAFEFIDEVWVASQHIHDLVAPISPVPVLKVTMPVLAPTVARRSRADLGLPQNDEFLFLFVHDYHSVAARKNPTGLIEAFKRAFAPDAGPKLVIKSINAQNALTEHDRVVLAAADRADIILIDAYVSAAEKNAMIAHCDCYVSLHRSEGFGLTLAEAMLLGKPVIATGYGGTMEFTNSDNSYLVNYRPVLVGDGAGVYPAEALWAEPDVDAAADLMRHVVAHRAEARARGELARAQVAESHSPAAAGATMERRLRRIHEHSFDQGVRALNLRHVPPVSAVADHLDELGRRPEIDWASGRWGPLSVRGPMSEWIRSSQEHQRSIDTKIFDRFAMIDAALREVGRALSEQQHARHSETLAMLRRLERQMAELRGQDQTRADGRRDDELPTAPRQTPDEG